MTIALQYTNVTVNDVDESIAFYRDALGLEVQNDVKSGGHRWVTLGTPAQPGLGIVLSDPHAGRSQEDGDALPGLGVGGIVDEAQERDEIADVLALKKFHAARDVIRQAGAGERELHFEGEEVRPV